MGVDPLDILQMLRIKGLAPGAELAAALGARAPEVEEGLRALERESLVVESRQDGGAAWSLSPAGIERHGELAERRRGEDGIEQVKLLYQVFLDLNAPVKELVSEWQEGDQAAEEAEELGEELAEIDEQLAEAIEIGAGGLPRLAAYGERFGGALARVRQGDWRYFADPTLPSYHTVWFECHEDLLLTLGRSRAEEEGA